MSFDGFASHDGFGYPQQLESSGQNHSLAVDITMFFFCVCCMGNTVQIWILVNVRQMDDFLAWYSAKDQAFVDICCCYDAGIVGFISPKHKFEEGCVCHGQQYGALTCRSFKLFIYIGLFDQLIAPYPWNFACVLVKMTITMDMSHAIMPFVKYMLVVFRIWLYLMKASQSVKFPMLSFPNICWDFIKLCSTFISNYR